MTDQQTYSDPSDVTLTIDAARGWGEPGHLSVTVSDCSCHPSDHPGATGLFVPTARLLAMIDTEDPDAMRAYLRETADARCTTLEEILPPHLAAEAARFRAVPEADSPEDVDEHPDPVEQMRESGRQLGEAWRALSDAFREASKGSNR